MQLFSSYPSFSGQQQTERRLARNKEKLMQHFQGSLRDQALGTAKLMQVADRQTTLHQVAAQQINPMVQSALQPYACAGNSIPQTPVEAPPITSDQKLQMGRDMLKSTPDVFVASGHLLRSDWRMNAASKREDKVLKDQGQLALERDRNMQRFQGDKFYDAFESQQEMAQAYQRYYPPKLLTPENNDNQILYSDRFQQTMKTRYAPDPFNPMPKRTLFGKSETPPIPKPIAYHSSKGPIYDAETMEYLANKSRPEDLSWLPQVRGKTLTDANVSLLSRQE